MLRDPKIYHFHFERGIIATVLEEMDLDETDARNGCAGEGQQQFNRPTVRL
jgi:hypothetical protein